MRRLTAALPLYSFLEQPGLGRALCISIAISQQAPKSISINQLLAALFYGQPLFSFHLIQYLLIVVLGLQSTDGLCVAAAHS